MATTKLILRKNKANSEGQCVIFVLYTHKQRTFQVSTGEKIHYDFWDEKKQQVKRSYRGYTSLNQAIQAKETEVKEIANQAKAIGIDPTIEYVREKVQALKPIQSDKKYDFLSLYEAFITSNATSISKATAIQHRTTISHLKAFSGAKKFNLSFQGMNQMFYEKFITYMVDVLNFNPNTVGKYIKNLKAFLSWANKSGHNEYLTFKDFKKPKANTDIIYLNRNELSKLIELDLSKNNRLDRVRDIFVFECATGLRYSDLYNLKPSNIKSDRIEFVTIKTKDKLIIPLTSYARHILDKYDGRLPQIISNQKMNDYLKELGELAQINEPVHLTKFIGNKRVEVTTPKYELLSTHVSRRTFITQSLERGLRPEIIMRITGHKDLKTMMRYVKITDNVIETEMFRAWNDAPVQMKVV